MIRLVIYRLSFGRRILGNVLGSVLGSVLGNVLGNVLVLHWFVCASPSAGRWLMPLVSLSGHSAGLGTPRSATEAHVEEAAVP